MLPGPALAHHTAVVVAAAAADKVLAVGGAAAAVVSDGERIGESVQSSQAEGGEELVLLALLGVGLFW